MSQKKMKSLLSSYFTCSTCFSCFSCFSSNNNDNDNQDSRNASKRPFRAKVSQWFAQNTFDSDSLKWSVVKEACCLREDEKRRTRRFFLILSSFAFPLTHSDLRNSPDNNSYPVLNQQQTFRCSIVSTEKTILVPFRQGWILIS